MNNNNFAIMRYFRDLGVDAHLLLYSNDGKGTLSHFSPESDTWDLERWSPFIHQTSIPNAPIATFDFPLSTALSLRSKFKRRTGVQDLTVRSVTRAQLHASYSGYDRLIGSGSTPAALSRIGRSLDIFYPYSIGVEFLDSYEFTSSIRGSWFRRFLYRSLRRKQLRGLSSTRCVLCTDQEVTGAILRQHRIFNTQQAIPMVYNREILPDNPPTKVLADVLPLLNKSGLSLLHHARLMWKRNAAYSKSEHLASTKNSDWLFRAFAALISSRPAINPRLFVVEYGPDVEATKDLVHQLGIASSVTWLPIMARRELMWILDRVSVGIGEFTNPRRMIWGGTGWETLASGKPLLQAFKFNQGEFARIFGYPPPPILSVKSEADVLESLLFAADHPSQLSEIGRLSREWFDAYNGIALAKNWLSLAINPPSASYLETSSPIKT